MQENQNDKEKCPQLDKLSQKEPSPIGQISILTPTYNREKLLGRLYDSLLKNCNSNQGLQIEWLVMDDGSTDNTREVIKKYENEKKIIIKYFFQENKGKMTALNFLVKHATGDFIIECDSDDYFTDNAFELILNNLCFMKENTYALCFLKYDQNMKNIGGLAKKQETNMFDLYFKDGECGEKALVFNARIRKLYEHALEKNERFVTEARMYHKMDLEYKMQCINEPIMVCEYQENGYTNNIQKLFKENPYGYLEYFKEIFEHDFSGISWKKRIYVIKHYILFSVLTNNKKILEGVRGIGNKFLTAILYIPGKILTKKKF